MPAADIMLLSFIVGAFCLLGGALAFGSWTEWRDGKARQERLS